MLANAYESGDSSIAPGLGRDPEKAIIYRTAGCELGHGSDCHRLGEVFETGVHVPQDKEKAAQYYRLSCGDRDSINNTMTGFSCWKLGLVLLDISYLRNYMEAMAALDKGCVLQPSTCASKKFHQGTGLVPSEAFPEGAAGYSFGLSSKEVDAVCMKQGGQLKRAQNGTFCEHPTIDALKTQVFYVNLEFCTKNSLCSISIAMNSSSDKFYNEYLALKGRLAEIYGLPSKIVVKGASECMTVGNIAACLETGSADFASSWIWNEKGFIALRAIASHGSVAILLGYDDAKSIRRVSTSGL